MGITLDTPRVCCVMDRGLFGHWRLFGLVSSIFSRLYGVGLAYGRAYATGLRLSVVCL